MSKVIFLLALTVITHDLTAKPKVVFIFSGKTYINNEVSVTDGDRVIILNFKTDSTQYVVFNYPDTSDIKFVGANIWINNRHFSNVVVPFAKHDYYITVSPTLYPLKYLRNRTRGKLLIGEIPLKDRKFDGVSLGCDFTIYFENPEIQKFIQPLIDGTE
jgi:hypothetical protein